VAIVTGGAVYNPSSDNREIGEDINAPCSLRYETEQAKCKNPFDSCPWHPDAAVATAITSLNSSWASYSTQIGDIILQAAGGQIPFVLRKDGDFYLFVGACSLIRSELDLDTWLTPDFKNPGFSDIMRYGTFRPRPASWNETYDMSYIE
jgi:hypothetical protein